ncbi:SEC-C domain-containing protein [Mycolicibacillus parakoreensis]|uniref:SEC-C domain-containing protein n=1 Tax=Mycolicibacillus parakoreensis TaxID=1069221 RepID=A0ABY3TWY2_9MYCO|nr:SEC-C domain-containing protein [Mycolicibacillus parakoreensis]MCV7316152.1 SEC-C domain-containing protein [Mycolicibacillus parakoreensis]ULN52233.1 SEC-C domain-containing protein [Mycolicibacillus parakoreensis]
MTHSRDPILALTRVLIDHGPVARDDIKERLQADGVGDPHAVVDRYLNEIMLPAAQLSDDRWVWLPTLLAGRVFTHRLTDTEIEHDMVTVTPDLNAITALCEHAGYQQLDDGTAIRTALAGYDDDALDERGIPRAVAEAGMLLLLAPGTLAARGLADDDLIAVSVGPRGLHLRGVDRTELAPHPTVGARLGALVERTPEQPEDVGTALWTICADDPNVFTAPLAPIAEIADERGLARDGEWLARPGFDFSRWRFEVRCTLLTDRYDLAGDEAFALVSLTWLCDDIAAAVLLAELDTPEDDPIKALNADPAFADLRRSVDLVAEIGGVLRDPLLAEALAIEVLAIDDVDAPVALGLFAEVLEPKVPHAARVACRWLRAVAADALGDVEAAEQALLAAESMDTDWPLVLQDLARIASDRGDVERGLALLRRAGADEDNALVELLQRHRVTPRGDLGRNAPCWCGSGRKYKKCHLGHEQLPLPERIGWLYAKAVHHALRTDARLVLTEVGLERHRYDHDDEVDPDFDPLMAALADPLTLDVVLFEGGAFSDFLRVRGVLLPDDERLLAEQWLLVERSVFEVDQVRPGHTVTVRDVRTGDVYEVSERTASRQLRTGELLCARVLPVGDDTWQFFGGIEPLALHERGPLIELLDDDPDPVTVVAALSRRFAPASLVTTAGEPMMLCEATVAVEDPDVLAALLDVTYQRDDGALRWHEILARDDGGTVRATLDLDGDTLQVTTTSETRMDRVLGRLAELDPTARVVEDTRRPMGDARQAAELAASLPGTGAGAVGDPDDPALAAALDQVVADYETRWLDESIPALDGYTPRQAAEDPTRRGDLIRLLDSFPAGAAARGGMDADRLRAALGLD